MRIMVSVIDATGNQIDRVPSESELQCLAECYAVSLLQASLPGSHVVVSESGPVGVP